MLPVGSWKPPVYPIYHLLWSTLDWLYPPKCGGCGKQGIRWCPDCQNQCSILGENVCSRCGDMLPTGTTCANCLNSPPPYTMLRSWGVFKGPLRKAIHRLKYEKDIGLAESLSTNLISFFRRLNWDVDLICAVPLSKERFNERGYNQSALIAIPMSLALHIPYSSKALHRIRNTKAQVGLSQKERLINVKEAFRANPGLVKGKSILIIDDVTTTGATMSSCAQAFLDSGASAVFGMTVSRPAFFTDSADMPDNP